MPLSGPLRGGRAGTAISALAALLLAASGAPAVAAEGGLPQFDPTVFLPQIAWLVVIFGSFYLLIVYVMVPRVERIKSTRQTELSAAYTRATELLEQVQRMSNETDRMLLETRQRVRDMVMAAERQVQADNARDLEQHGRIVAGMVKDAEVRIDAAKSAAIAALPGAAEGLALSVLEKLGYGEEGEEQVASAVETVVKQRLH